MDESTRQRGEKLLRLALDRSAGEGEAENAGARWIKLMRSEGVTYEELIWSIAPNPDPSETLSDLTPEKVWQMAKTDAGQRRLDDILRTFRINPTLSVFIREAIRHSPL